MGAIAQIVKSLEGFNKQQSEYCKEDQRGGIGFAARIEPDGQRQNEQQRGADQHLINRRWQGHAPRPLRGHLADLVKHTFQPRGNGGGGVIDPDRRHTLDQVPGF